MLSGRRPVQDVLMLRIAIASFALLAACSRAEPTLDTTSKETMERSLAAMAEGLTEAQKEELGKAVFARMLAAAFKERDADAARRTLHGLTAAQLLVGEPPAAGDSPAAAAQRREQQRAERADKLALEIQALELEQAASALAKAHLAQFRVLASTFAFEETEFDRSPTIALRVRNDTAHAISRAYFDATLATPGRAVPWVDTRFNYEIPGGLEPGEEATWRLEPNRVDDWGRAPADRDDMVLALAPYRVDGADGKALYDARGFDVDDDKRLRTLRAELEALAALPATAPR